MKLKELNTLILGAGISGLTFAKFYKYPYAIVEKENEIGGLCRTIFNNDYIWDYSGHFFHFNTKEFHNFFNERISKNEIVSRKKKTSIFYKNRFIDYPFQMNIHQLPKAEFIDCLYDLFNKVDDRNCYNFEKMLYGKFGKSITEKFLKPYNEKLYACNLNELDEDAMGRFFPYADIKQIINNMKHSEDNSYNSSFIYPKKGASRFIEVLEREIRTERIALNTEVISVDIKNRIAYTNEGAVSYKYLINTMPLNKFVNVLNLSNHFTCEELHSNKVLVFNIGFDKKSHIDDTHWIYFPDKSVNFYRVGFYDNILGGDKLSIYVEIGFDSDEEINSEEQFQMTLYNLKKCGVITDHRVCAYKSLIIDPAYVHINSKSRTLVEELKQYLKDNGIYTIGRYGSWTYCSIEDCMVEAKELAKSISSNNSWNM